MEKRKLCKSGDSSVTVSAAVVTSQKLKNIHRHAFWERLNTRKENLLFVLSYGITQRKRGHFTIVFYRHFENIAISFTPIGNGSLAIPLLPICQSQIG